jgi:hypothetical protein
MKPRAIRLLSPSFLAALAVCAIFATSAAAKPAWRVSGESLKGSEVTVGFGVESSLTGTLPIATCEHFLYRMNISNSAETGKGEVTELPLFNCTATIEECEIETIEGEGFPWPAHLKTMGGSNYLIIEGITITIVYTGALCPLSEVLIEVTGSAGGVFDNETEAAMFDEASAEETGTGLETLGSTGWLEGGFPTEAFQWHREEPLSVS